MRTSHSINWMPLNHRQCHSAEWRAATKAVSRRRPLFLALQVEVGLAAGAGVNNCGEVTGVIVSVAATDQRKRERKREHDLGFADGFSILPTLAVDRHVVLRRDRIREGF